VFYYFVAQAILGFVLMTWALNKMSKAINIDEERDSQFPCWRRTDTKNWNRVKLYVGAMLWMPTRLIIVVSLLVFHIIVAVVLSVNVKSYDDWIKNS